MKMRNSTSAPLGRSAREKGASAVLIGLPDAATQSNKFEVAIPKLASFYLTHDWQGEIKGIKSFPDQHPPVAPVFFAFRLMVGVGLLMLAVSWFVAWQIYRKKNLTHVTAKMLLAMTFSGWLALIAGWYVTEVGRQPWLVYNVLTTAQAASQVSASHIALTLGLYLSLYAVLLIAYVSVIFHLAKKATQKNHPTEQILKQTLPEVRHV